MLQGRFLLAAASGHLMARSLDSLVSIGREMMEQLSNGGIHIQEDYKRQMVWKRVEYSAMLKHVQAHVAPTDVDPGAGLQWLPKILRSSPKVKRTGALLERVFMPCTMYFRYSRHKGATADLKVEISDLFVGQCSIFLSFLIGALAFLHLHFSGKMFSYY